MIEAGRARRSRLAITLMCLLAAATTGAAQNRIEGRWTGEADQGVIVTLDLAPGGTLVMPGIDPEGKVHALKLPLRDLHLDGRKATFSVELPDDEGTIEFEFRATERDAGALKAVRVDGDPADDDDPHWALRRAAR